MENASLSSIYPNLIVLQMIKSSLRRDRRKPIMARQKTNSHTKSGSLIASILTRVKPSARARNSGSSAWSIRRARPAQAEEHRSDLDNRAAALRRAQTPRFVPVALRDLGGRSVETSLVHGQPTDAARVTVAETYFVSGSANLRTSTVTFCIAKVFSKCPASRCASVSIRDTD